MVNDDAQTNLLAAGTEPALGRWWVLFTVSLLAASQSATWAVPGTLASAYQALGADGDTVQLLENYGSIFFFLGAWPSTYFLDRFGCAAPVKLCTILMLGSNALLCLATVRGGGAAVPLLHASAILCSLAGPVAITIPALLAQQWFGATERTSATAIAATASQVGGVVVYAAVPLLSPLGDCEGLLRVAALLLALSAVNCAGAFAYFPRAPRAPPSRSDARSRAAGARHATSPLGVLRALRALFSNPAYLAIVASYAASGGLFSAAGVLLPANLAQLGASLSLAAWVGVALNCGAMALGVGVALGSDALRARGGAGWAQPLLVGVTLASGACFAVFAGLAALGGGGGDAALPCACLAYALGGSLLAAQTALSYDLAAEHTWRVGHEGACLTGVSLPMNAVTLVALAMPAASLFSWLNWAQAGASLASAALLWAALPAGAPKAEFDLGAAEGEEK